MLENFIQDIHSYFLIFGTHLEEMTPLSVVQVGKTWEKYLKQKIFIEFKNICVWCGDLCLSIFHVIDIDIKEDLNLKWHCSDDECWSVLS